MKDLRTFLRTFNDAWAEQDLDTILAGVTDDFRFQMANCSETISGKAAFADWFRSMDCGEDKATITIEHMIVDEKRAALTGDITFTGNNAGHAYAFCDVYTLRGERICELKAYCVKIGDSMSME